MMKPLRRIGLGLGVLAALLVLAFAALRTAWFQSRLERRVVESLESLTGGRVEVQGFRFRPLALEIVLRGLVIHGRQREGESPFLAAQTATVRVNPLSLIRQRLLLRSLDWDTAELHFYTRPDGSTNLVESSATAEVSPPIHDLLNLEIESLSLARTKIIWDEAKLSLDLEAENTALLLRYNPVQGYLGSLSSSGVHIRYGKRSLPTISASARFGFSGRGLEVSPVTWQCAGIHGEGTFNLVNWFKPKMRASFHAEGGIAELAKALELPAITTGTLVINGSLTSQAKDFAAQGRVEGRQISIATPAVQIAGIDLSSEYSASSKGVEMPGLNLSALGGNLQGRLTMALENSSAQFALRGHAHNLRLEAALRAFKGAPSALLRLHPASQMGGAVEARWSDQFRNFRSAFDVRLDPAGDMHAGMLPVGGEVGAVLSLAPSPSLLVQHANLTTPHSRLDAQGSLSAYTAAITFQASTSDFAEWRPVVESLTGATSPIPLKLHSEARFAGELSGTLRRPEVRGRFELGRFEYRAWTWDSLGAKLQASPDRLEIAQADLRRAPSSLGLSGFVSLTNWKPAAQGSFQLTIRAKRTPLEGLFAALDVAYPLQGYASGDLSIAGPLSEPSGKGEVRLEKVRLAEEPIDSFSARLRVAARRWFIEDIQLAKGAGRMTGQASVDPSTRQFQVALEGRQFALSDIKHLSPRNNTNHTPVWGGIAAFDIRGEGFPGNATLAAHCDLTRISLNGAPIGDFHGQVEGSGPDFHLRGALAGPEGELHLEGSARGEGNWPLEISGEYVNFSVAPWIRWLSSKKLGARVTANGSFNLRAPLKDLSQLEIDSKARDLEISFPSLAWKNEGAVELHYRKRRLTASQFRLRGPATDLVVEGSVNFLRTAELLLNAQGTADATLLSLFDPGLQASGRSQLRLRASGDVQHPLLNGTLSVQDVSLGYADLPFRLSALEGEVALEGDRATIKSLRGSSGGGSVVLTGFATLGDLLRFNILMELSQARVRYPSGFTSVLDGNLRLVGSPARAQLGGELAVRQMFAGENFNWLAWVGEAGGASATKLPGISSPYASKVRLDIQVGAAPAVRVETHDLHLVGDINLRLQGTLANPVQVGTVQIISGEAVFRGNRYKIDRGNISMTNPFRTQPFVDVQAETRIERYELTVTITGPLDRLRLSYSSDPPLPTVDIVSLLAFGYAHQEEEMSTARSHPVSTVGASALLSEALSTQVSGRIQRLFGVSRIKIDPNVGALTGTTGGARVTVEQQVTRDFTLTYVTTTGSAQQRIIQFEWNLSDRISLLGDRDQNGVLGLELRFRRRFK